MIYPDMQYKVVEVTDLYRIEQLTIVLSVLFESPLVI